MASIGSAPGIILGVGVGAAVSAALEPAIEVPRQEAWSSAPYRVLEIGQLAIAVAQGGIDISAAYDEARRHGYDQDKVDALVYLAQTVPGVAEALSLWRIGLLGSGKTGNDLFAHALTKHGLDPRYAAAIIARKTAEPLDLGAIATAVHRGIMDDAGLLVTPVPTGTGHVPRIPVSPLDTVAEFAAQGIEKERARVLIADTGLPLSLGEMLSLYNRGKVTDTDVKVSIAESNVRNEYMDVALELARRLLTPHEAAEAELRGVMTTAEAKQYAALSGISGPDYDTLFAILGRPLNLHAITTGLARGGTYGGTYNDVPAGPYRDAIRRSAIRPEYASLDYANRYTYPSAFVLRSLAQAGDLGDEAAVAQILEEIGWKPSFAREVAAAWLGGTAGDPNVKKAHTKAWTEAQTSYVNEESTAADVQPIFNLLGVAPAAQTEVLAAWDAIRALTRKQLSPAQIVKAVKGNVTNPATGLPWTQADGLAALQARGYDAADATTLLNE